MKDSITIESPVDMHVHFRQGEMLGIVAPLTAGTWAGALAMPNTEPVVDTPGRAKEYRAEILKAAGTRDGVGRFDVYTSLYFRTDYTRAFLESARPDVLSVKFYPKGLTTNSDHGCDPGDDGVLDVLGSMEELGIPLNVHAESPGYHEDREALFTTYVRSWARRFPGLTIVVEHLSDGRSTELLELPNVYATLTPQHLLLTGDDLIGPPLRPHNYCMPVLKRPEDRRELLKAAVWKYADKVMAGTDSAPHAVDRKLTCGCAGCFTAPIALQLYATAFDSFGHLGRLQNFLSGNARRVYGVNPPGKSVTLVREPFVVPDSYGPVVPLMAGQTIPWSVRP